MSHHLHTTSEDQCNFSKFAFCLRMTTEINAISVIDMAPNSASLNFARLPKGLLQREENLVDNSIVLAIKSAWKSKGVVSSQPF